MLGLVVEIQSRRRIFVPIGRVTSVEPAAVVLTTGSVNLRRFEQRPGEALVLGDLLDRTVTVAETGAKATVVDAAMEQTRTRDWVLTRIAVREHPGGRLPRRRGHVHQVDWSGVDGLGPASEDAQGADTLLGLLSTMRAADLANVLQDLGQKRRQEVVAALDDERLADVLEEMPEDDQVAILAQLADERAADVLEAMDPDDAADLLGELPTGEQERLLQLMEPDEAEPVRRLLRYSEDTAGGLMTSEPIILSPDATVAEALARVRNPDLTPALATQVYVCRPPSETPTGRYLGVAHVQRLLREPPSALVSGVVDGDLAPLRPETTTARADPLPGHVRPGRRRRRRRQRPAGRRGHRGRRAGPPAARGLAGPRRWLSRDWTSRRGPAGPGPATTPRPSAGWPRRSPASSAPRGSWSADVHRHHLGGVELRGAAQPSASTSTRSSS